MPRSGVCEHCGRAVGPPPDASNGLVCGLCGRCLCPDCTASQDTLWPACPDCGRSLCPDCASRPPGPGACPLCGSPLPLG